jgi:hypothetical protein
MLFEISFLIYIFKFIKHHVIFYLTNDIIVDYNIHFDITLWTFMEWFI